jgi:TolA-binding protein
MNTSRRRYILKIFQTHGSHSVLPFLIATVFCMLLISKNGIAQDNKENSEFKLAINLYNDGMLDLALQQIKNFIDAYPATAQGIEARYYLGLTQLKLKRYEDARFTFQNFALSYVDNPKAPEAWLKVGEAFSALHNDIEAAAAYERVKTFFPKSPLVPDALLISARLFYKIGEIERAKKTLRTILDDYPKNSNVYLVRLTLAEIYIDEGQTDLAEQEARHIAESDAPVNAKSGAMLLLGKSQYGECLFDVAENTLRENITKYPNTSGAIRSSLLLGKILIENLKYNEAIQQFQSVVGSDEVDSIKIAAFMGAGFAAMGGKNYAGALKYFEQVINDHQSSTHLPEALYQAGRTMTLSGKHSDAIEYFKRILHAQQNSFTRKALIRMAETASLMKDYQQAAIYYSGFLAQYPSDPGAGQVMLTLGELYENNVHDYRKAISVFRELVQKYPRSSEAVAATEHIGTCDELLGDFVEAVQTYTTLLHDYPAQSGNETLQRHIDFLQIHKVQDRDEGLQKLSRLMGEIILDKPKPQLSLELADIYFHDLKDYRSAAEQYTNAIDKGLGENEFINAYFSRARAFHFLSEIDSSVMDQAITYYEAFVKQFPANTLSNEAAFYSIQLKSRRNGAEDFTARSNDLLSTSLEPRLREQLLYNLATNNITSPDSGTANRYLYRIGSEFPASSLTQKAYMITGDWLIRHGHADSAIVLWRQAIEKSPNGFYSAAILNRLGEIQISVKDYSGVAEILDKLSSQFPYTDEGTKAKNDLPGVLQLAGKYSESIKLLEAAGSEPGNVLSPERDTSTIDLQLAISYDKLLKKDRATQYYLSFLHKNNMGNHASQAFYALGVIAKAEGNTETATSYFKQAALHGGITGATQEIAEILFENEQYDDAAKQYNQLAQSTSNPAEKKPLLRRAVIATLRDDKLAEGQKLSTLYRATFPEDKDADAEFLYETGLYQYRQKNYKSANETFDRLAGDFKDTQFGPWGYYYKAKILEVTNALEDAAKRYDDVLKDFPNSDVIPHVLLSLGNMHFNAERYDQSIKYYQTIIEQPGLAKDVLPFAMNNLIQAYETTKLYDAALKVTKDYIAKFPTDENIVDKKIKVGLLYTKLGYFDQAVVHFQNLINESGSLLEAELRYNIGDAYYNKGAYEQAILEYLKVPYLVSRQGKVNWTATALYMAGQSYEKMSKFNQAIEMYQQIIDRSGIDATFKAAAKKEIERVKTISKQ